MKTTQKSRAKGFQLKLSSVIGPVTCAWACLLAASAAAQDTPRVGGTALAESVSATAPSNRPPAAAPSPGVAEILKLVDAGVSTDVVITFIEASATAPKPTDLDVIVMKEHKVPDEIVKLLLNRAATERSTANKVRDEAILSVVESRRATAGGFDPESYDYFRTYYLQPRALASANERLSPFIGSYAPRGFGYSPGYGYGGGPFSARPIHRGFR